LGYGSSINRTHTKPQSVRLAAIISIPPAIGAKPIKGDGINETEKQGCTYHRSRKRDRS
jgi:hypothetical protein